MNTLEKKLTYARAEKAKIDLGLSESPLGPSPHVIDAITHAAKNSHHYPQDEKKLIAKLAEYHGISEETILLGAGANELLEDYLKLLAIRKNVVVPSATFPESVACVTTLQGEIRRVPIKQDFAIDLEALLHACDENTGAIHLCNPNNPTGIWTNPQEIYKLADASPVPLLISEASADYVHATMIDSRYLHPNIIIVRSLSKSHGLAGLRIGYSVASAEIITKMKRHLRSYRLSSIAIAAAIAALNDTKHLQKSIAYTLNEAKWLAQEMQKLGFDVTPSHSQTFIARVPKRYACATEFCREVQKRGVAVVDCSLYAGLEAYIRVSPQMRETNQTFIKILTQIQGG